MTNNNSYGGGQNTYNPLKNKGRNKKIITIIIFLVLIVVSISFALFNPSINLLGRRNIKISKCELDINFKESDELMLVSKYPISKEGALKYDAKDITITNNSTCDTAYFKLTIKDLSNSSINKDKINYQLIDKSNNNEIADKNPDNFLVQDSLTKGNSKSYSIRIWIDERATNTDLYVNGDTTKPIEYKYALNIEATDKKLKEDYALDFALANVGQNGLELVTHEIDDTLQVDSKFASEYRYRGGNVNNYVTFNNETWRIIGIIPTEDENGNVENRFKIVSQDSLSAIDGWDTNAAVSWENAEANTYLNDNYYYDMLNDTARGMIGTTKYYLGLAPGTSSEVWKAERSNSDEYFLDLNGNVISKNHVNKLALIYASDYGYAADSSCDALTTLTAQNVTDTDTIIACKDNNWMYQTLKGYIITQPSNPQVWLVIEDGVVRMSISSPFDMYPVLTLSSNVKISGGSGTSSDPYQLQLN